MPTGPKVDTVDFCGGHGILFTVPSPQQGGSLAEEEFGVMELVPSLCSFLPAWHDGANAKARLGAGRGVSPGPRQEHHGWRRVGRHGRGGFLVGANNEGLVVMQP